MKINFKEIIIKENKLDLEQCTKFISEFNNSFNEENIKLLLDNEKIILFLRQVDISKLKKITVMLYDKYFDETSNLIMEKVNNIKSYGIKGNKRLYVNYNKERKVKNRKKKEENRGKFYYANNNDFNKENNKLPDEFLNQILTGDSETILKKLPSNCVDIIFTSPPYNFGLEYTSNADDHKWEEYFNKLFRVFDESVRVLKWGGRIIINQQPLFSDYIPSHHIISNYFIKKKLIWKGEILWEKNNYNCKYTAWGSWKSPSSPYLKYTWEFLEVFCKGSLKKDGKTENIDITPDEFKNWVFAKWSIAPERDMKKFGHPAMFPEKLVERVLKLFSYKNDIILDPFNGLGTTTLVSKKFNRNYIGIDISEEYCKKAKVRLDKFFKQEEILL